MRSRTSFFNPTVFRKDITRFAPVWVLYTIALALALLTVNNRPPLVAGEVTDWMMGFSVINFFYAGVNGMLLFGDLAVPRMSNMLHAMPLRRECWFVTHTAAGLFFSLAPNVLCCLVLCLMLRQYFYMALLWLAVATLSYIFYFAVAAFAAVCGGNRIGVAAVYVLVNFLSWMVYGLISSLFMPLLYGVMLDSDAFSLFSPLMWLGNHEYMKVSIGDGDILQIDRWFPSAWWYLGVCAAVGAVLWGLSLLIYRARRAESAGDFISFAPVAPVFLLVYTLACGIFLCTVTTVLVGGLKYLFLAVGVLVGFFTGRMLLRRTTRVFQPKAFIAVAAIGAVLAGSLLVTAADVFGVVGYVPPMEEVSAVTLSYQWSNQAHTWKDPADIAKLVEAHETVLEERDLNGGREVVVTYTLKSGRTVRRLYNIGTDTKAERKFRPFLDSYQFRFDVDNWEDLTRRTQGVSAEYKGSGGGYVDLHISRYAAVGYGKQELEELMEALRKDYEAGRVNLGMDTSIGEGGITLELQIVQKDGRLDGEWFYLDSTAQNTWAYLASLGAELN